MFNLQVIDFIGGRGRKEFELLLKSLFKLIFINWKATS